MAEKEKYYIRIEGKLIEVEKDVYETYYKMGRRERYLEEQDKENGVVSYHAIEANGIDGEAGLQDMSVESVEAINSLIANPEKIATPQTRRPRSQRLEVLQFELDELINQLPVDEERARQVLQEIVVEMYTDIDPREYETQRMRRAFQNEKTRSELDANLIAMHISSVQVDSNGKVRIKLKNDQIIERGE